MAITLETPIIKKIIPLCAGRPPGYEGYCPGGGVGPAAGGRPAASWSVWTGTPCVPVSVRPGRGGGPPPESGDGGPARGQHDAGGPEPADGSGVPRLHPHRPQRRVRDPQLRRRVRGVLRGAGEDVHGGLGGDVHPQAVPVREPGAVRPVEHRLRCRQDLRHHEHADRGGGAVVGGLSDGHPRERDARRAYEVGPGDRDTGRQEGGHPGRQDAAAQARSSPRGYGVSGCTHLHVSSWVARRGSAHLGHRGPGLPTVGLHSYDHTP